MGVRLDQAAAGRLIDPAATFDTLRTLHAFRPLRTLGTRRAFRTFSASLSQAINTVIGVSVFAPRPVAGRIDTGIVTASRLKASALGVELGELALEPGD